MTADLDTGPPLAGRPEGRTAPSGQQNEVMQLTDDMQRVVREQSLGFVATVRPDGTPALSPKGTTSVWDAGHLVFLHVHSPHTVDNLRHNPHVEINVVDPIVRKGYRFAGLGRVVSTEAEVSARWRQRHLDLDLGATEAR